MFQNSKNELPPPLQTFFTPNANVHTYFTRHRNNPHTEHRSSYIISKMFVHKGLKLWFELPTDIKEVNNHHHCHHVSPNVMKTINLIIFTEFPLKATHIPIGYRDMDDLL